MHQRGDVYLLVHQPVHVAERPVLPEFLAVIPDDDDDRVFQSTTVAKMLDYAIHQLVKKRPIMGYDNQRSPEIRKVLLYP